METIDSNSPTAKAARYEAYCQRMFARAADEMAAGRGLGMRTLYRIEWIGKGHGYSPTEEQRSAAMAILADARGDRRDAQEKAWIEMVDRRLTRPVLVY